MVTPRERMLQRQAEERESKLAQHKEAVEDAAKVVMARWSAAYPTIEIEAIGGDALADASNVDEATRKVNWDWKDLLDDCSSRDQHCLGIAIWHRTDDERTLCALFISQVFPLGTEPGIQMRHIEAFSGELKGRIVNICIDIAEAYGAIRKMLWVHTFLSSVYTATIYMSRGFEIIEEGSIDYGDSQVSWTRLKKAINVEGD